MLQAIIVSRVRNFFTQFSMSKQEITGLVDQLHSNSGPATSELPRITEVLISQSVSADHGLFFFNLLLYVSTR